jgi:glycosyltransferase involved in cell wall biosynthesis
MLPALQSGGVERGTLEVAAELVRQGHRSVVISGGGRLVERLTAQGSEHVDWDVGRKSLRTLRYVRRLRRWLMDNRVDILHLRSRVPAWVGYLAWKGMPAESRPHLVTTVHGPYSVNRYSAVMTRGERVIAVSEMIRDYITGNYPAVDPDIIRVIHRGVDPTEFPYGYRPAAQWLEAWYRDFPQTLDQPLILLPARLTRWKGQEDFIELMQLLRTRGVAAHGLLVGGADPRRQSFVEELQAHISAAGLEDRVTLVGHRGDLKEIMAVSDIVLSLSREPEAFGRTTLEALSLGRPVIGYDHGGVREQLAAILPAGAVGVGDVAQVAQQVCTWLAEPPAVPRSQPFTLANMLDQTLQVYQELLERP